MKQTIEFIIYPNTLGLDITGPLEVFNTANSIINTKCSQNIYYTYKFTSEKKGPISLNSGLNIIADTDLNNTDHTDMLIIPGGIDIKPIITNKKYNTNNLETSTATSTP